MQQIKRTIGTILVTFVVILVLINFHSSSEGKGLIGIKGYTVISDSMRPTLKSGDYILIRKKPFNEIKPNTIISFKESASIVTHRVVTIDHGIATTRGDSNQINDLKQVSPENYVGSFLLKVPFLGFLFIWLQEPIMYACVIVILTLRLSVSLFFKK